MTIGVPALVALVGLLVFAFAEKPRASTSGLVAYAVGLLVFLATFADVGWRIP